MDLYEKKIDLHYQSRKTADLFSNVFASASLILSQLPIVIDRPVFLAFVIEKATNLLNFIAKLAKLLTSNFACVHEHIACLVKKFHQNL